MIDLTGETLRRLDLELASGTNNNALGIRQTSKRIRPLFGVRAVFEVGRTSTLRDLEAAFFGATTASSSVLMRLPSLIDAGDYADTRVKVVEILGMSLIAPGLWRIGFVGEASLELPGKPASGAAFYPQTTGGGLFILRGAGGVLPAFSYARDLSRYSAFDGVEADEGTDGSQVRAKQYSWSDYPVTLELTTADVAVFLADLIYFHRWGAAQFAVIDASNEIPCRHLVPPRLILNENEHDSWTLDMVLQVDIAQFNPGDHIIPSVIVNPPGFVPTGAERWITVVERPPVAHRLARNEWAHYDGSSNEMVVPRFTLKDPLDEAGGAVDVGDSIDRGFISIASAATVRTDTLSTTVGGGIDVWDWAADMADVEGLVGRATGTLRQHVNVVGVLWMDAAITFPFALVGRVDVTLADHSDAFLRLVTTPRVEFENERSRSMVFRLTLAGGETKLVLIDLNDNSIGRNGTGRYLLRRNNFTQVGELLDFLPDPVATTVPAVEETFDWTAAVADVEGLVTRQTGIPMRQQPGITNRMDLEPNVNNANRVSLDTPVGIIGRISPRFEQVSGTENWGMRLFSYFNQTSHRRDFPDDENRSAIFRYTLDDGTSYSFILALSDDETTNPNASDPSPPDSPYNFSTTNNSVYRDFIEWLPDTVAEAIPATLDFALVENSAGWRQSGENVVRESTPASTTYDYPADGTQIDFALIENSANWRRNGDDLIRVIPSSRQVDVPVIGIDEDVSDITRIAFGSSPFNQRPAYRKSGYSDAFAGDDRVAAGTRTVSGAGVLVDTKVGLEQSYGDFFTAPNSTGFLNLRDGLAWQVDMSSEIGSSVIGRDIFYPLEIVSTGLLISAPGFTAVPYQFPYRIAAPLRVRRMEIGAHSGNVLVHFSLFVVPESGETLDDFQSRIRTMASPGHYLHLLPGGFSINGLLPPEQSLIRRFFSLGQGAKIMLDGAEVPGSFFWGDFSSPQDDGDMLLWMSGTYATLIERGTHDGTPGVWLTFALMFIPDAPITAQAGSVLGYEFQIEQVGTLHEIITTEQAQFARTAEGETLRIDDTPVAAVSSATREIHFNNNRDRLVSHFSPGAGIDEVDGRVPWPTNDVLRRVGQPGRASSWMMLSTRADRPFSSVRLHWREGDVEMESALEQIGAYERRKVSAGGTDYELLVSQFRHDHVLAGADAGSVELVIS